jgi:hypothetical protein
MRLNKIITTSFVLALSFALVGVAQASHDSYGSRSSYGSGSSSGSDRITAPSNVRAVDDITAELPGQPVVGVRWNDNSTTEEGFVILRSHRDGRNNYWYEVGRVGRNVKNFHDKNVERGVEYWYKVQAFKTVNGKKVTATSGASNGVTPHFQGQNR